MSKFHALIDANSVGYFEHYGTKLTSGDLETQSIFGFVHRARTLKLQYPGSEIIALWDGRAQWRFDLCPSYKSNRDDDPRKKANKEAYAKARPFITRALQHLGVRQLTARHHEADDLAGLLCSQILARDPENRIVLHTGDHDWYQLIRPGVVLRDHTRPDFVLRHDNFKEHTGYNSPIAFLEGKALQGDSSDVIPGIPKLGEATALEFLTTWGSVRNFFNAVDAGEYEPKKRASTTAKTLHPEQVLASPDGRRTFVRNLKVMQLLNVQPPGPGEVTLIKGKPDKEAFADLCGELAFMSILKDIDNFFAPFV